MPEIYTFLINSLQPEKVYGNEGEIQRKHQHLIPNDTVKKCSILIF